MRITLIPTKALNEKLLQKVVEDVLGPLEDVTDVTRLVQQLQLPDVEKLQVKLSKLRQIELVNNLGTSNVVSVFTEKFYKVQNCKTTLASLKGEFLQVKYKWQDLLHLFNAYYMKQRSQVLLKASVKGLRNKEIQQAAIDSQLTDLIDVKVKLDLAFKRIEQMEKEFQDTQSYLETTYSALSRQLNLLQLQFDSEK